MEGFSLVDIYETKGAEYLFVIAYLVILILFWKLASNPGKVFSQIRDAVSTLSVKILNIPQGIYFNKNHTWTHLGESGAAKVGLDDFLQHVIGNLELTGLKESGDSIKKGELLAEIEQNGKKLRVFSPISGEVLETNDLLAADPGLINDDPFGYIDQIKAYAHSEGATEIGWLAMDKTNGYLKFLKYDLADPEVSELLDFQGTITDRVKHLKEMVKKPEPDKLCYKPKPDGKSGNLELAIGCSYCQYKRHCYPNLRAFKYSNKPKFLCKVVKEPKVQELRLK